MAKKYHVYLTYDERRLLTNSLIDKKNELLSTDHYIERNKKFVNVNNLRMKVTNSHNADFD